MLPPLTMIIGRAPMAYAVGAEISVSEVTNKDENYAWPEWFNLGCSTGDVTVNDGSACHETGRPDST